MCGIAGVVEPGADVADRARHMADRLEHRGPDSVGVFARSGAAVVQRRLRVIDLATGDPPITNSTGAIGVALNGEIYNYRSLRDELRRAGNPFATAGDTEVIAHLADDLEPVALCRRLDGMFAFALWDDDRRRLILGRDRFGKKPLYYWTDGIRLVFGSEIKAVVADAAVPRRLDDEVLDDYLTFGYVPTPRTFFDGVRSVPPGHVLTFRSGGPMTIEPYWSLPLPGVDGSEALDISFDEARREVRRLMTDAVDRRLVADVPVGAFLSGGIDSSTVVALMARLSPSPVRTFTIGFDDDGGFDERSYAATVAKAFHTVHTEFVVDPGPGLDKAALVERLVHHHDQPFGDSSALPTFLLAELTRQHVTVALSGDGGDELLGGYERYAALGLLRRMRSLPPVARRTVSAATRCLPAGSLGGRAHSLGRLVEQADRDPVDAYRAWVSYVPDEWRRRLRPCRTERSPERYSDWALPTGAAELAGVMHLDTGTYLLDDLLPKVDRMSMAHALEVRSPFLDTELAEFVARLPPTFKVRGVTLKRVLKAAVADLLPRPIVHRRKRGFGVPLDRWLREDLRPYVESMLGGRHARVAQHCDGDAVRALVAEQQSGAAWGHALWTLLTLEVFLRREGW